jgi:maltose O-acetyltransferase
MSFLFILRHREQPPVFTKAWAKVWAKRVLNFPGLVSMEAGWYWRRAQGVKLGNMASVGCKKLYNPDRLTVGDYSFVGQASIQLLAPVTIGKSVVVNDGVTILTGSHDPKDARFRHILAPVVIKDYAWVATNATILPGVTIGEGAIVGAGAVVAKDVPDHAVVVGNPARPVSTTRCKELDYKPNLLRACYEAWVGKPWKRP